MLLSPVLAVGAFAATVACGNSAPTAPTPVGQIPPPVRIPAPSGRTPSPTSSDTMAVTIQDFSFSPASVTIKVGTSVRWTNNGPSAHTTTSDMGVWDSGIIGQPGSGTGMNGGSAGGTFTFTFMQPGTFTYHCAIHPPSLFPGFVGSVTVTQ